MSTALRVILVLALIAGAGVAFYRAQVYQTPAPPASAKLYLVTGGSGPYWQVLGKGAQAAANERGATLTLLQPEQDENVEAQTQLLTEIDPSKADGIALSPLDAEQQTRIINKLSEATNVVSVDSDAPLSNRLCYIGASNYGAGNSCARLVRQAVPGGGKVCVLVANLTKSNVLDRKQGLTDSLAGEDPNNPEEPGEYEIVAVLSDEGDAERGVRQLEETLDEHSDLDCIVGLNARHGAFIRDALEKKEMTGKLKVIAFDAEQATLEAVENETFYATIVQDPFQYGYEAVRWLVDNTGRADNRLPLVGGQSTLTISTKALRADDVATYREQSEQLLAKGEPASKSENK